jgi:hypothetical protein
MGQAPVGAGKLPIMDINAADWTCRPTSEWPKITGRSGNSALRSDARHPSGYATPLSFDEMRVALRNPNGLRAKNAAVGSRPRRSSNSLRITCRPSSRISRAARGWPRRRRRQADDSHEPSRRPRTVGCRPGRIGGRLSPRRRTTPASPRCRPRRRCGPVGSPANPTDTEATNGTRRRYRPPASLAT